MKRSATAVWNGTGKEGNGTISTDSAVVQNASYSHRTRFTDTEGTSPEELLAAAHAACFSMKLSFVIEKGGAKPERIETRCTFTIDSGKISSSHLEVKASIPGASAEQFSAWAEDAKTNCPVSQLLRADITLTAALQ
jgi:osmotically inducible protein OsmC